MGRKSRLLALIFTFSLIINTLFVQNFNVFANIGQGYIFENNVHIREDASADSKSLAKVSEIVVEVIESKKDIKLIENPKTQKPYNWYKVSFTENSKTTVGFVREDLISIIDHKVERDFNKQLSAFPKSYHNSLLKLHLKYPNWQFVADNVSGSLEEVVALEDNLFYKLTQSKYFSWRSMRKGCYDWSKQSFVSTDNGTWYGASREVIAYYMDPRNFLNEDDIYIFMKQSFDSKTQTVEGIEKLVKGTFLDSKINNTEDNNHNKRYAEVILLAANKSHVNPYVLASTLLQEQGSKGTVLSNGADYKQNTVYNFFNFGATGSNKNEVIYNAKKYAYYQKWFTATDSIVGGAVKFGKDYINSGQDTYFYKNYNVLQLGNLTHQYAQNVADSLNSSKFLKTVYKDIFDMELVFRIPVYKTMPDNICKLPENSNKLNNYYFSNIEADGLTPSFNRYTFEYSLTADCDFSVKIEVPKNSKYTSDDKFSLKKGNNEIRLVIQSQTGYTNAYIINIDAQSKCVMNVLYDKNRNNTDSENGSTVSEENSKEGIINGDTNGDGIVTTSDLANVRLYLLDLIELKGDKYNGADTNHDGKITTTDLANIRLHLLDLFTLK